VSEPTFSDEDLTGAVRTVKAVEDNPIEATAQIIDQAGALQWSYAIIRALVRRTGPLVLRADELRAPGGLKLEPDMTTGTVVLSVEDDDGSTD
jgi:hypothetical protein